MSGNSAYKNYLLIMLMLSLSFGYVDRMVFSIVQEGIKLDLHLSDTQLGAVNGFLTTVFFSLISIPIARWTDRGNRVTVLSLGSILCGVTVALCSAVGNFLQLILVRIGTAAGEVGCIPVANSLIPDYFSRAERPRASARYMLGIPVGLMVGYLAGGWLNERFGWRMTFLIIGINALALGVLTISTLKEPRRSPSVTTARPSESVAVQQAVAPTLKEVIVRLSRNATFRNLVMLNLAWYFCGWALLQWLPTFFIRSYGMTTGELGTWLAIVYGGGGVLGTWLGGEWCTRYATHNEPLQLRAIAVAFVLLAMCYLGLFLAPNRYGALAALAVAMIWNSLGTGSLSAMIQTMVPERMRATAWTLVGILPTLIGTGLGPLGVGILSDALQPWAGAESLRYALMVFCPVFIWAAWHSWRASRTVTRDLASGQEQTDSRTAALTGHAVALVRREVDVLD